MANIWYPQDKEKLNKVLDELLTSESSKKKEEVNGLIVPHAGYEFSGKIAGKAFAMLKDSKKIRAIVLGPSHYTGFEGIRTIKSINTPLAEVNIPKNDFGLVGYEHSVDNEIPFLQKLGFNGILPLVVGEINNEQAKEIAEYIAKIDAVYIFSTDLSHFLPYDKALKKDKKTIKIIKDLDFKNLDKLDACGKYPLMILMELCKLKAWKPQLIEYKNSGDITGDKSQVVGYASFSF